MAIPPELLLAAASLLAAIAAGVVWLSLRRRTTPSDHPHCRKCRFDLFGLPSTSDRCPECGAAIGHPRATVDLRILARRRRGMIAILAVLLIATSIGSAWRFIHNPQHTALQPNLVLLYLMERDAHAQRAESALVQRLENNQLGSTSHAIIRFRLQYWLERRPPPLQMWRQTQVHKELVIAAIGQGVIVGAQRDGLLDRSVELDGAVTLDSAAGLLLVKATLKSGILASGLPYEFRLIQVSPKGNPKQSVGLSRARQNFPLLFEVVRWSAGLSDTIELDCEVIVTVTPPGREPEIVTIKRSVDAPVEESPLLGD